MVKAVYMRWVGLCMCSIWAVSLLAQTHGDNFQTVKLDRDRLALGDTLIYTIEVHNATIDEVFPPDFDEFEQIGQSFREENSSIIAGQSMLVTKINYRLVPLREGVITIDPGRIRLEGRLYYTNSRRVEVLPPGSEVDAVPPSNFLRLEIDRTRAYVGQQIIVDLRLYTTVNRKGLNQLGKPSLDGFISKPRGRFDNRTQTVAENGKTYLAQTIESYALYPVRSGKLIIEPFAYSMSVQSFRPTSAGFRQPYTDFINLVSDSLSIEVLDLPQPPSDFSGGIGDFRVDASINRDTLSTDDALSLRLTIMGDGDIFRVREIFPADPEDWDIYPPDIQVEEMTDSPTAYFGRKVMDFQLVPRKTGRLVLNPVVVVFKPDTASYVDIAAEDFTVQVGEGMGRPTYDTSLVDTTTTLTLFPSVDVPKIYRPSLSPSDKPIYWVLFALPLLFVGGLVLKQWLQLRVDRLDPIERAQSQAARNAYKKLKKARSESIDQQYAVIERTLLQYLKDRLDRPLSELSKSGIQRLLLEEKVTQSLADEYVHLLKRCEQARYKPGKLVAESSALSEAKNTIRQIEEWINKKPVTLQEDGQTI